MVSTGDLCVVSFDAVDVCGCNSGISSKSSSESMGAVGFSNRSSNRCCSACGASAAQASSNVSFADCKASHAASIWLLTGSYSFMFSLTTWLTGLFPSSVLTVPL